VANATSKVFCWGLAARPALGDLVLIVERDDFRFAA
jgi:hypothetical protein